MNSTSKGFTHTVSASPYEVAGFCMITLFSEVAGFVFINNLIISLHHPFYKSCVFPLSFLNWIYCICFA